MKGKATLAVLVAGSTWGLISIYINNLDKFGINSLQIAFLRSFISAILLFIYLIIQNPGKLKVRIKDCWCFIGTGIISLTLFNVFYFSTIINSQASIAVMLLYTSPIFVMLLSVLIFKEKISLNKIIAIILTFGGCISISGVLSGSLNMPVKVLITGLGSGLFYALYSIFGRFALDRYEPVTVTFYTFIFASVGSAFIGKLPELICIMELHPVTLMWGVGISVVSTIIPYLLYTYGLSKMETGRAAIIVTVEPVVATLVGVIIYHEQVTAFKIIGLILILLSVVVLNINPKVNADKIKKPEIN